MAKIQNVGIGNYIKNPSGTRMQGGTAIEILQIATNDGNSFLCYPVVKKESTKVTLDTTRYYQIPIDKEVEIANP